MVKMKVILAVSVLIVASVLFYSSQKGVSPIPKPASSVLPRAEVVETAPASRYIADGITALGQNTGGRRVLFFYADWCPTCRPVDRELRDKENEIPGDVTIYRINYNDTATDTEEKDLAEKYSITYQHTFVQIDGEGEEIAKWNGGGLSEVIGNMK